jgi:hypothetical protein
MIIDLSLANSRLYSGLTVGVLAGRPTLLEPPEDAITVIVGNLSAMTVDPEEVVLTGGMAIWAYLAVFHSLHGKTKRIYYQDGRGHRVLVAAHG